MKVRNDLSDLPVKTVLSRRQKQQQAEAEDVLKFYLDNYSEVYELICDSCKETLALEYRDFAKPNKKHHQAREVIPVSDSLRSYRPRLDGAMGYQCKCGNDTRVSEVERGIIPLGPHPSDILPHHVAQVEKKIAQLNYHPDIRLKGKDTITETFRVRRIK